MGLKNLVIPTETINVPGNDPLVVRGLDLPSILFLVRHHQEALSDLFNKAQGGVFDDATVDAIALAVFETAPELAAKIIACACDEPDEWQNAMRLPVSVQVQIIERIGVLTFAAEGGVEKLLETVVKVLSGAARLPGKLA